MKNPLKIKRVLRMRRHRRIRAKIFGTKERPRLSLFRSSKHLWAQVIDDRTGHTIVAASTKELKGKSKKTKTEEARLVGALIARRAKEKGISRVVFDRGGYAYHGRLAAFADAARAEGLSF